MNSIFSWWYVDDNLDARYTKEFAEAAQGTWKPDYFPRLHISNNLGCAWSDAQFTYKPEEQRVYRVIDCRCDIKASFRFENFPFDLQLLPIKISLKHDCEQWEFVPFDFDENDLTVKTKPIAVLNKGKIKFADFDFFESDKLTKDPRNIEGLTFPEFGVLRKVHFDQSQGIRKSLSQIAVWIPVQRRSNFYILNHFAVESIITTMAIATWSLPLDEVGTRYDLVFTLFLTAVALKLVQAELIPRVSYLTYMDIYTFTTFIFLLTAAAFHFSAHYYEWVDETLRIIFIIGWGLANLVFLLLCMRVKNRNWDNYFTISQKYFNDKEVWFFQECASRNQ